jgi:hypothetical protein
MSVRFWENDEFLGWEEVSRPMKLDVLPGGSPKVEQLLDSGYLPKASDVDDRLEPFVVTLRRADAPTTEVGLLKLEREQALRIQREAELEGMGHNETGGVSPIARPNDRITSTPRRVYVEDGYLPEVLSKADYVPIDNPDLAGVRARYMTMLSKKTSYPVVVSYLVKAGITDQDQLSSVKKQLKFRRAYPHVPLKAYSTEALDDMWVPATPTRLEARVLNARQEKAGASDLFANGFVFGLTDESGGAGNVLLNMIEAPFTDRVFDPVHAYRVGKEAELLRLDEARSRLGARGSAAEMLGGLAYINPRSLAQPVAQAANIANVGRRVRPTPQRDAVKRVAKAGAAAGALNGFGYGDGFVDSTLGATSGTVLGGTGGLVGVVFPKLPGIFGIRGRNIARLRAAAASDRSGSQTSRDRRQYLDQEFNDGKRKTLGDHFASRNDIKRIRGKVWRPLRPLYDWWSESPLNVYKPAHVTIDDLYGRHFETDPDMFGARMPDGLGGGWSGRRLGLEKQEDLGRIIIGAPPPLKVVVSGTAAGGNAAAASYVYHRNGKREGDR